MAKDTRKASAELVRYALGFPEAWEDHPWGETVVKVRKKVFVFFGQPSPGGEDLAFSVKLPESGLEVLDRAEAEPTGYGLGKSGWVTLRFPPGGVPTLDELRAWIDESYRAVAPKTLVRELDARG